MGIFASTFAYGVVTSPSSANATGAADFRLRRATVGIARASRKRRLLAVKSSSWLARERLRSEGMDEDDEWATSEESAVASPDGPPPLSRRALRLIAKKLRREKYVREKDKQINVQQVRGVRD